MKNYKKQRNKFVALRKKCIKEYFDKISNNNIVKNKNFWNFIRLFLLNKGSLNSSETMLRQEKKIITDTKEVVQVLNDHYINKGQRSWGEKPTSVAKQSYLIDDIKIVDHIVCHYEDHPSVRHIKKNVKFPKNSACSLLTISAAVDTIPPKLVKLAGNYSTGPLSQSINNSIKKGSFPKMQKLPQLLPYKRNLMTKTLY